MNLIYQGFRQTLTETYGKADADAIWQKAGINTADLKKRYPEITGDSRMMILPAAGIYLALKEYAPKDALPLLISYGTQIGTQIRNLIHGITAIPGVPTLLWLNMPALMRKTSSPKAGYTRKIVSETRELVAVDILSCPLHDAAVKIGLPEITQVVCAMDKVYMIGFRHIRYTRTTSVAEGGECCDYRLCYDKNKK